MCEKGAYNDLKNTVISTILYHSQEFKLVVKSYNIAWGTLKALTMSTICYTFDKQAFIPVQDYIRVDIVAIELLQVYLAEYNELEYLIILEKSFNTIR